jgi:hypothetical protein
MANGTADLMPVLKVLQAIAIELQGIRMALQQIAAKK